MSNKTKFGPLPEANSKLATAKVVILPVPYDDTSTWLKGADMGPAALLRASRYLELYDIETDSEVYRQGIFTAPAVLKKSAPEKMVAAVKQAVAGFLAKDKLVVTVGGEHSVSIVAASAYRQKYKNLSVLQLDAHTDLRVEYYGSKYNHGCVMGRIKETSPIVQVGIRSMGADEKPFLEKDRVFFAHEIYNRNDWQDKAIAKLTEQVYISLDLDVFDPSVLPSTGTPEPGGLNWYQVMEFLKKVVKEKQVVGFDVVELCPNPNDKSSDFLAAKLIYMLLSYKFAYGR
ncbi:agmatinase [Candidatus Falkowbacteria bacterium RIFCSPHIGHO2_02_FULL_42_9]|uniref:Agmatinase n=1 Tax=Candidatus Falkowbacteria bacterium RIFCSPHIGHO2_02_FULL_42_9 TaxID=1797986 RepID=A0A1F5S663_9BACT|nr:MAG: agmatinase [Candidatus Falkowbacteria bacterium RIFCSPHIGHO2_02_FULL_42_9]